MHSLPHPAVVRFLARLQRSSVLSEDEQRAVLQLAGQEAQCPRKRDLVRPGDKVAHATLVVSGTIGRYETLRSGARSITAVYIGGDMADLHSVTLPTVRWGLTSLGPSTVLRMPHVGLRELAVSHPNLALAFWRDTALDAAVLAKWIANVGRKDAIGRTAHFLCEIALRVEAAGLGERADFESELIQEQLGDVLGLTAVHVNRTLRSLRENGIMSMHNRRIQIHNWDELAYIAEFVPEYLSGASGAD